MKQSLIMCSVLCVLMLYSGSPARADSSILCASTTSTQNSGLFGHILPLFQQESGIHVKVVAVGTGAALEIGRRGDADVVLVHAKEDELKMLSEGWFVDRHDLMYNDFVLLGPAADPAGIHGMKETQRAMSSIASKGELFVSRGDNSGTHKKELTLWSASGTDPTKKDWYLAAGQGMAKTLRIAGEKRAYTLSDRGTYLTVKDKESIDLDVLVEGDPLLFNQYGVMAVNPEKHSHIKYTEAMEFITWLTSEKGQNAIASFKDGKGNQLFTPNAKQDRGQDGEGSRGRGYKGT